MTGMRWGIKRTRQAPPVLGENGMPLTGEQVRAREINRLEHEVLSPEFLRWLWNQGELNHGRDCAVCCPRPDSLRRGREIVKDNEVAWLAVENFLDQ